MSETLLIFFDCHLSLLSDYRFDECCQRSSITIHYKAISLCYKNINLEVTKMLVTMGLIRKLECICLISCLSQSTEPISADERRVQLPIESKPNLHHALIHVNKGLEDFQFSLFGLLFGHC